LRRALEERPDLGAVAPRIVDPEGKTLSTGGTFTRWTMGGSDLASGRQPDYLTWASVVIRREVLQTVGLLDERFFMYWEDVDFGLRLRAEGWGLTVDSSVVVEHAIGSSHGRAGALIQEYATYGLVRFALKLPGAAPKIGATARVMKRVFGYLALRDLERSRACMRGAVQAIRDDRAASRTRSVVQPQDVTQ
jgi:GT2 family glycosyltransferase